MSRAWATVGLVYWLYNVGLKFMSVLAGAPPTFGIVSIIVLMGFIHGVRGTFAYHRYAHEQPAAAV